MWAVTARSALVEAGFTPAPIGDPRIYSLPPETRRIVVRRCVREALRLLEAADLTSRYDPRLLDRPQKSPALEAARTALARVTDDLDGLWHPQDAFVLVDQLARRDGALHSLRELVHELAFRLRGHQGPPAPHLTSHLDRAQRSLTEALAHLQRFTDDVSEPWPTAPASTPAPRPAPPATPPPSSRGGP